MGSNFAKKFILNKNKKGNFWSLLYVLTSLIVLIVIYVATTPIIEELIGFAEEILPVDSEGLETIQLLSTIWFKVFIAICIVSLVIYAIASALRKEPYYNNNY